MPLYAIRNYDSGQPTGYLLGQHGPMIFPTKREAEHEAERLNTLPHAANRVYRAEPIKD